MQVYQRRYELYVVQPFKFEEIISATNNIATEFDLITDDNIERLIGNNTYAEVRTTFDNSLLITDPIQLEADIKYKRGSDEGTCEIKLHNLSNATLSRIKGNYTVLLKAGYITDKELPIIYVGTIQKMYTKARVTTLYCKEGGAQRKDLLYNRSYMIGVKYSEILLDITSYLAENGIPSAVIINPPQPQPPKQLVVSTSGFKPSEPRSAVFNDVVNSTITTSYNLSGSVFKSLSSLCESLDYVWFLSRGMLYIQPRNNDRFQDFIDLKPNVVIEQITPANDVSGISTKDPSDTGVGINFTCFCDARMALENLVKVGYGEYTGNYVIDEVHHKLNWFSGVWQTEVKTKPAPNLPINQNLAEL